MSEPNILLINPTFDTSRQYGQLNRLVAPGIPLSLGALSGYLKSKGVEVKIVDEQVDDLAIQSLQRIIAEFKPNIVGISCTTPVISRGIELSADIKKISADIMVILGGAHPTVMPEECLNNENIDMVVRGEGEITLWECVRLYNNELEAKDILGLSYRKNSKIIHNHDRPFVENLDFFPKFDYTHLMISPKRYNPGYIISSRGCPHRCIFCAARSTSGNLYRTHSPERIIEEIETFIREYQIRSFMFIDDDFLLDNERVIKICNLIIKEGFSGKVRWRCQARASSCNRDVLEKMKKAGCVNISFGIETASERIMKLIDKRQSVEDNIRAVRLAKEVGLDIRGSFILGLPTETKQESLQTISLAKSLPLVEAKFSLATPYPGTKLYEIAIQEGHFLAQKWDNLSWAAGLSNYEPVYFPIGWLPSELKKLQRRAYLEFYLRPKIILNMFKRNDPDMMTTLPHIRNLVQLFNYAYTLILFIFDTIRLKSTNQRKNKPS